MVSSFLSEIMLHPLGIYVLALGAGFLMVGVQGGGHQTLRLTPIGYGAAAVMAAAVAFLLVLRR